MLIVVGLRTDMAQALMLPVFWIKSAYNALLAIAAFAAVYRLSRPDGSEGRFFGIAAAIILALAAMPPDTGLRRLCLERRRLDRK